MKKILTYLLIYTFFAGIDISTTWYSVTKGIALETNPTISFEPFLYSLREFLYLIIGLSFFIIGNKRLILLNQVPPERRKFKVFLLSKYSYPLLFYTFPITLILMRALASTNNIIELLDGNGPYISIKFYFSFIPNDLFFFLWSCSFFILFQLIICLYLNSKWKNQTIKVWVWTTNIKPIPPDTF
ncbi:MAG: hypothetical protein COA79_22605 [Planctomycetota bacterium]|nr:MAG: hypothetical protein COA79_22605 [Planctomycetota bacterium]